METPENRSPKPFVFVLMPFSDTFDDIYQYGIKEACETAGAYCERVDEQTFQGSILERIYNQIAKADLIISDMTGRNANVFYETGYAHALGKRVILLTQADDDIPFDLKHHQHIVYGTKIQTLEQNLTDKVLWYINNPPPDANTENDFALQLFVEGQQVVPEATLMVLRYFVWVA